MRVGKYITDTPWENSNRIEAFKVDDYIVILQDNLYSIAWEAESKPAVVDHPKTHRDPIMLKTTNGWHFHSRKRLRKFFTKA